mgnify:CR=1 FL=1
MGDVDGWSCDERNRAACRNGHGCHCREITALRRQVEIGMTALRRINSLAEKNVPKYAQQIAKETLS